MNTFAFESWYGQYVIILVDKWTLKTEVKTL